MSRVLSRLYSVARAAAFVVAAGSIAPAVASAAVISADANDGQVSRNSVDGSVTIDTAQNLPQSTFNINGQTGANYTGRNAEFPFVLGDPSSLPATITSATLNIFYNTNFSTAPAFNTDLYGLPFRTTATLANGDYFEGATDAASTRIVDNYVTKTTTQSQFIPVTDGALLTYLNAQLSAARAANATNLVVFFRLSPDAPGTHIDAGYGFNASNAASNPPTLTFTPEPSSAVAGMFIGGLLLARRRRRS